VRDGRDDGSHFEIFSNGYLSSRNVCLPSVSFTNLRMTREICMYSVDLDPTSTSRFVSRRSSRDSLPLVNTCTIDRNAYLQLVVRMIHSKCLVYDTWTKEIESTLGRFVRFVLEARDWRTPFAFTRC